ncbi:MAG: lysylphosphatidylglycerol synthase domain-containing protein [Chitinivorax sp.]
MTLLKRWLPWLAGLALVGMLIWTQGGQALLAALAIADIGQFGAWLALFVLLWWLIESWNLHTLFLRAGMPQPWADIARLRGSSYLWQIVNYSLAIGSIGLFLRRRSGVSVAGAGGVMAVYMWAELVALALLALPGIAAASAFARSTALIGGGFVLLSLALALLLRTNARLPRLMPLLRPLRLFRWRDLLAIVAGRALYFAAFIAFFYCTLPAFGIAVPLPVLLAAVPAIFLAGNLPISAAGVGTIQAGMLFCFHDYAMPQAILAFGLCYSAGLVFGRLPLALACIGAERLSAAPAT